MAVTKLHPRTAVSRGCYKIPSTHCCIAWLSQNFIHALLYRVAVSKFHPRTAVSRGCHKMSSTYCCIAWLSLSSIHALLYRVAVTKLTRAQQHYVIFSTKSPSHQPINIERRLQIHNPHNKEWLSLQDFHDTRAAWANFRKKLPLKNRTKPDNPPSPTLTQGHRRMDGSTCPSNVALFFSFVSTPKIG